MPNDRTYATGDPWRPSAGQFNFWTEGARAALQNLGRISPVSGLPPLQETVVRVQNTTGDDLPQFGLIAFKDVTVEPGDDEGRFLEQTEFAAIKPPADDTGYFYGVLKQALSDKQVGLATIYGVTPCRITGTGGAFLEPQTDDTEGATSELSGWPVIWQETGSASRWCVIALSLPNIGCRARYEIRHWYHPSGGNSTIDVTYNAVTETIDVAYNASDTELATAINAHSELSAASKTCSVEPAGARLGRNSLIVTMPPNATIDPTADPSGLTPNLATGYDADITVTLCSCG